MHLLPELAACHDVSIPELLASRDEDKQDSAPGLRVTPLR